MGSYTLLVRGKWSKQVNYYWINSKMTWAVEIVKRVYSVAHTAGNKTMYRLRAWGFRHDWMPQNVACLQDLSETHLLCFRWQLCGVSVVCLFFGSSWLWVPLVHASERYPVEHVWKKREAQIFFVFIINLETFYQAVYQELISCEKFVHSPEDTARRFKIIL